VVAVVAVRIVIGVDVLLIAAALDKINAVAVTHAVDVEVPFLSCYPLLALPASISVAKDKWMCVCMSE
jgi:hypothetical protein